MSGDDRIRPSRLLLLVGLLGLVLLLLLVLVAVRFGPLVGPSPVAVAPGR